jgi:signal transduction histidine kinase
MSPELAALAVHDLKNALGHLEHELSALERDPDATKAQQARQHCVQLRQRFVNFLMLYGAGSELKTLAQDESPRDFLQHLIDQGSYAGSRVLTVIKNPDDAPPFWFFDVRLIRLALDAALDNAWRFAKSRVELSACVSDGGLLITVEDDGPGLHQHDDAAESAGQVWSTGLGLQLCEAVAGAHEHAGRVGHAKLANRAGGGARFELWLP